MSVSKGVSPHHFLGGGMCREEATSAFLATLIEQSVDFQSQPNLMPTTLFYTQNT